MSKTINELRPTDRVIVRLGAKTQRNEQSGEDVVIDPQKDMDVTYGYWLAVTDNPDEFYAPTSFYRPIGRTVHLMGLAGYADKTDDTGGTFQEIGIIAFETEEGRALAKQLAQLEEKYRLEAERKQAELAEQQRLEAAEQAELEEKKKQAEATRRGALLNAQNAVKKANDALKKAGDNLAADPDNADLKEKAEKAQQVADEAEAALAALKSA